MFKMLHKMPKINKLIETQDYKFTRAKKHSNNGRIHDCCNKNIYNSIICMYVRLAIWCMRSSNYLTNKQYKTTKMRYWTHPRSTPYEKDSKKISSYIPLETQYKHSLLKMDSIDLRDLPTHNILMQILKLLNSN